MSFLCGAHADLLQVGWVIVGILLGPNLADIVPKHESWMLIGEVIVRIYPIRHIDLR